MVVGQMVLIPLGNWLWGAAPAGQNSMDKYAVAFQWTAGVVAMPFIETLLGQYLPIRLLRGSMRQSWVVAALVSALVFTGLHGYTDRSALPMFLGGCVLAGIFVTEAQRQGRPILSTYLTHAMANAMVLCLRWL